jgi:hypothetical protein
MTPHSLRPKSPLRLILRLAAARPHSRFLSGKVKLRTVGPPLILNIGRYSPNRVSIGYVRSLQLVARAESLLSPDDDRTREIAVDELLTVWQPFVNPSRFSRNGLLRGKRNKFPSRAPPLLLNPILGLRLCCRLPLHISGRICATTFQRHNVINHESRTSPAGSSRRRAWVLVPELTLRYRAPFDVAAGVALTG